LVNRNLALKFLVEITDHQRGVIDVLLDWIKLSSRHLKLSLDKGIKIYF
jgi:hypothetical protein